MTMTMPTEVSEQIEPALSPVAGYCAPDFSQLVYRKNFRRIYLSEPFYAGCDSFSYSLATGIIVVPHRLSEPPLV